MKTTKATRAAIRSAAQLVKSGGVIVYPTDTVYGVGCDPFDEDSVERLFTIKGDRTKPFPILASEIEDVEKIAQLSREALNLAEKFWPGPLTIVMQKKPSLPNIVTVDLNSVAVRIPNHDIALELIRLSGGLLIGTSANKTGKKSPRTALEAARQIGEEVDLILDGGTAPIGASSAIVDLTGDRPKILRKGTIKLDDLLRA
jgi:L-threonylcarbamoyladenylate synthase